MAAAGYPNGLKLDFLVRDSPNLKLWAVASQAMLKETLNIEANIRMGRCLCGLMRHKRGLSISRSVPSCRRCSTPPITLMPGMPRARRKITPDGATKSFKTSCHRSIVNSTRPGARPYTPGRKYP